MDSIFDRFSFDPPSNFQKISCIDMHTGGEPLRIPIKGLPHIEGKTVLEKRAYFKKNFDHLRTALMYEPRGHADMYGAILSEPSTPEADYDVLFIHNEGYSTMCGHAIIALTKFIYETRFIQPKQQDHLVINVPAGTVKAKAIIEGEKVVQSSFVNVPSFLYLKDKTIELGNFGTIKFDVSFGGAFYAIVDAGQLQLSLDQNNFEACIKLGREIKKAVMKSYDILHPVSKDLSFLYGTIFTGNAEQKNHHSRNVCIFADGELDRSATGSGVSARAALHYSKGELPMNSKITIESILGSTMDVEVIDTVDYHGYKAVIPRVSGSAYFSGKSEFWIDPDDPFKKGFIFR